MLQVSKMNNPCRRLLKVNSQDHLLKEVVLKKPFNRDFQNYLNPDINLTVGELFCLKGLKGHPSKTLTPKKCNSFSTFAGKIITCSCYFIGILSIALPIHPIISRFTKYYNNMSELERCTKFALEIQVRIVFLLPKNQQNGPLNHL